MLSFYLCLIWKLKGYGSPSPREIRHLYILRPSGHGGTYFLLSSVAENWIPKGTVNPGQVEISDDEKKKGFIWGLPTSNKRWKNIWFFVSGAWGRDTLGSAHRNLLARKVPRHFTSPEVWSKMLSILSDDEISHLTAVAVLPLAKRGEPFLLDEEKMIKGRLFPLNEFDVVCDSAARAVKKSEVASQRHAAGLAKEGIAPPDGDDVEDSRAPSQKGKEKVGTSDTNKDIPIFDANAPEDLEDPASGLNTRNNQGKRVAENPPEKWRAQAWRDYFHGKGNLGGPFSRGHRFYRYKKVTGDLPIPTFVPEVPTFDPSITEASALIPTDPNVSDLAPPAPSDPNVSDLAPPAPSDPNFSVPPASADPNVQSVNNPCSNLLGPSMSASVPEGVSQGPAASSVDARGTSDFFSLLDFSALEILSHLVQNDVYVGQGWEHVKNKLCNRKMEFFFNCHSLMMSKMADNYRRGNAVSSENKSFPTEEKLLSAEEEIKVLRDQLSISQYYLAAHMEAARVAEKAKEKAEWLLIASKGLLLMTYSFCGNLSVTDPHPMHLEIPSKSAFNKYYSGKKESLTSTGGEPDLGPITGRDYEPFMPVEDEEIV
ncbi:hypothetical protein QYF36_015660 [Acer negundo]|nr:hypothetical protein QYF36_015660 [Acer negundo]